MLSINICFRLFMHWLDILTSLTQNIFFPTLVQFTHVESKMIIESATLKCTPSLLMETSYPLAINVSFAVCLTFRFERTVTSWREHTTSANDSLVASNLTAGE